MTYDHYLEEPGSLEVEYFSTFGTQRGGNDFHAFWAEFEYGATAWWTTELYLDGQTTFGDSTVFTGFRLENRFRLLQQEHWINPVLYVEYEQISGADKILKEIEGHDGEPDFADSNSVLQRAQTRTGDETSSVRELQGLEHRGESDCHEEPAPERAVGIRVCRGHEPPAIIQRLARAMQLLSRNFCCRVGDVWRPG